MVGGERCIGQNNKNYFPLDYDFVAFSNEKTPKIRRTALLKKRTADQNLRLFIYLY